MQFSPFESFLFVKLLVMDFGTIAGRMAFVFQHSLSCIEQ